jgi:hypothetical protein
VLERDVEESGAGFSEHVLSVPELAVDPDATAAAVGDPRGDTQGAVDEDGSPVADEDPCGHRREAVPGGEEAARLVERGSDEPAVGDPGGGLVPFREGELGLVALDPLLGRKRKVDTVRIVPAPPARRVVVRRDPCYRRPPRSKCAL